MDNPSVRNNFLTDEQQRKCDLALAMQMHLRDTRTSLMRAARAVGLRRRELFNMIAYDDDVYSGEFMERCSDIICAMPLRRFGLVSYRFESWRTPVAVVAREQNDDRRAWIRYLRKHPEIDGAERTIAFLASQIDEPERPRGLRRLGRSRFAR